MRDDLSGNVDGSHCSTEEDGEHTPERQPFPGVKFGASAADGGRLMRPRQPAAIIGGSMECVGWSDDPGEEFPSHFEFTIFEREWEQYDGARLQVWFGPENGGPDRKLMESNWKIEGWTRWQTRIGIWNSFSSFMQSDQPPNPVPRPTARAWGEEAVLALCGRHFSSWLGAFSFSSSLAHGAHVEGREPLGSGETRGGCFRRRLEIDALDFE